MGPSEDGQLGVSNAQCSNNMKELFAFCPTERCGRSAGSQPPGFPMQISCRTRIADSARKALDQLPSYSVYSISLHRWRSRTVTASSGEILDGGGKLNIVGP